jgi:signal transduction histidine kinase
MSITGVILVKSSYAVEIANAGQENLIHIMNHQIKGYLAKSRNIFSELLTEPEYGPLPEKAKPLLSTGFESMTEGVEFTQQILNASSVEKGTLTYNMKSFDLRALIEEVIQTQKKSFDEKKLSFSLKTKAGDYHIVGDHLQLKEAIRNLIDNSIHYTPSGSVNVDLTKNDKCITLSIKDTGIGLTESDKNKLFKKGGRGDDSLKHNVNSTGYGLFFVKGVVDAHHGKIWAESNGRNRGSTFYLELPTPPIS